MIKNPYQSLSTRKWKRMTEVLSPSRYDSIPNFMTIFMLFYKIPDEQINVDLWTESLSVSQIFDASLRFTHLKILYLLGNTTNLKDRIQTLSFYFFFLKKESLKYICELVCTPRLLISLKSIRISSNEALQITHLALCDIINIRVVC